MLDICITFDYELFFGENNGTYDEILFWPTKELLNILTSENATSTFFVDIYSYIRHKELLGEGSEYCDKFFAQLNQMILLGQDVQLHIHPHWIYSNYDNGKWMFSNENYSIQSFGYNHTMPVNARSIVEKGISAMKEILGNNYECIAFRAGGLTIQPERELIEILCDKGILLDSSIAPRMRTIGDKSGYDFRNVPRKKLNWYISGSSGINRDVINHKGKVLFEVPVGTIQNNIFRIFSIHPRKVRLNTQNVKGSFFKEKTSNSIRYMRKLQTLYRRLLGYSMLSLDTKGYELLIKELDAIYQRYSCDKKDAAIAIICHPKMLTDDSLKNLHDFIIALKNHHNKYKLCNMNDLAKKYFNSKDSI